MLYQSSYIHIFPSRTYITPIPTLTIHIPLTQTSPPVTETRSSLQGSRHSPVLPPSYLHFLSPSSNLLHLLASSLFTSSRFFLHPSTRSSPHPIIPFKKTLTDTTDKTDECILRVISSIPTKTFPTLRFRLFRKKAKVRCILYRAHTQLAIFWALENISYMRRS